MTRTRNRGNGEGSIFKRQDGGPYYVSWYDAIGKRKSKNTKTTDRSAAQRILAKILAEVALRRDGVIDARQEALITEAGKPIETHLADFEAMMKARARGAGHVNRTLSFIREVCAAAPFEKASDISADGMNRIMTAMTAENKAARTIQGRVVAMKAFTKWLTDHAKLPNNPLASIKRPSVKTDRRLRRRMLLPTEWPYLRAATITSGTRDNMPPLERVALYATGIQTGLRSAELRSLTKADLFLAGTRPYVRCKAESTKNKQEARQYIQADLAEELRRIVATKTPSANVFDLPSEFDMAAMLRGDLAEARKQWLDELKHDPQARAKRAESDFLAVRNDQGESFDFHCLRHTCGAWLALQGVHVGVIKTVMRHSTIVLTMDTYGHLLPDQHAEAVGGIARMMNAEKPALRAAVGVAVQTAVGTRNGATENEAVRAKNEPAKKDAKRNPLKIADLGEVVRNNATGHGGTRTHTPVAREGILSPLADFANTNTDETCDDGNSSDSSRDSSGSALDPDLARVVERWESLPAAIQAGIVAMVAATPQGSHPGA